MLCLIALCGELEEAALCGELGEELAAFCGGLHSMSDLVGMAAFCGSLEEDLAKWSSQWLRGESNTKEGDAEDNKERTDAEQHDDASEQPDETPEQTDEASEQRHSWLGRTLF